jgi:hypothetical protein
MDEVFLHPKIMETFDNINMSILCSTYQNFGTTKYLNQFLLLTSQGRTKFGIFVQYICQY